MLQDDDDLRPSLQISWKALLFLGFAAEKVRAKVRYAHSNTLVGLVGNGKESWKRGVKAYVISGVFYA